MKITIELTEAEYNELKRKAAADRRTPEDMAAWLVVKGERVQPWPYPVYPSAPPAPFWQPTIISRGTTDTPLPNTWRVTCNEGSFLTEAPRYGAVTLTPNTAGSPCRLPTTLVNELAEIQRGLAN